MISNICATAFNATSRRRFFSALPLVSIALRPGLIDGYAQGTIYTDRSAFAAALQSGATITFDGLPDPPSGLGRSPITVSGVTFTGADNSLHTGSGYLNNFDSSYPVGIFLPVGKNAFGADFSGGIVPQNNPFNATITVSLDGGQTHAYNFTGQVGSWTFLGFVFSDPIASLVYDDGGPFLPGAHEEELDNVTFGAAVPEPYSLLLAPCALVVWLCSRRRNANRPPSP